MSGRGAYILIIEMAESRPIGIGKLGEIQFPAGWYAYCGSAMRGFQTRLPHHLNPHKKIRWHIDYFLRLAEIKQILLFESETRQECRIAQRLLARYSSIPGFGCSDCQCASHLVYAGEGTEAKLRIEMVFSEKEYQCQRVSPDDD